MYSKLLLILFLSLGAHSIAQVDSLNLYLIHPKNKSEKLIKQGRRIRVWKTETDVIKGKYTVESDSTFKIGNDIYLLSDLNSIKCSTKEDMFGSGVAGILPLVLTVSGVVDLSRDYLGKGVELFAIQSGIGVAGLTACTYGFLYGRQRKIEKGWKYVIK
jgi:hypothetical protein